MVLYVTTILLHRECFYFDLLINRMLSAQFHPVEGSLNVKYANLISFEIRNGPSFGNLTSAESLTSLMYNIIFL
jgi:hypothetical protein